MSSTPIMPFQQNEKSASHRIWRHDIFDSSPSSKEEIPRSSAQTVEDGFDRPKRPLKNCLREKKLATRHFQMAKGCLPGWPMSTSTNIKPVAGLHPPFAQTIISDEGNFVVRIDGYGRTARAFKNHTSFPEGIDFSVREDADLRRLMDKCFFLKSCLRGVTHL